MASAATAERPQDGVLFLVEGREGGAAGDPAERARAICLRLLTGTPRTRKQLADALRKREIPEEVAEEVLSRFEEVGLINDGAFADAWVESRHHGRGLARRALARELRTKGVDSALIDEAVGQLDSEQEEDDRARARRPQAALHPRPRPRQAAAPPRGHARPQGLPRGHGPAGGPAGAGGRGRGHGAAGATIASLSAGRHPARPVAAVTLAGPTPESALGHARRTRRPVRGRQAGTVSVVHREARRPPRLEAADQVGRPVQAQPAQGAAARLDA